MIRKIRGPSGTFSLILFGRLQVARGLLSKEASLGHDVPETFTVNCRIRSQTVGEDRVVLRVSGQLTGNHVNMLRTLLEEGSNVLTLDLKDVRLVDDEAVKLLAIHELNGVRIDNCPPYIREWIRREKTADPI